MSVYWELHESGQPIQAARFGDWKAVRNGTDKPIEIHDLETDAGENHDLAASKPELVARAKKIFTESHRPVPTGHWIIFPMNSAKAGKRPGASNTSATEPNGLRKTPGQGRDDHDLSGNTHSGAFSLRRGTCCLLQPSMFTRFHLTDRRGGKSTRQAPSFI